MSGAAIRIVRRVASATVAAARSGVARERLARCGRPRLGGLMALALVTGVGAGLGAVAFRYMILGFTHLFTGHR